MRALDLIAKKRDAAELTASELRWLVQGFTSDEIPDYQVSAWLMAVYLNGMTPAETAELTLAMAQSGQVLDLSSVKRQLQRSPSDPLPLIADKHSTGGVGDKTTMVVAPLVAACGVPVGKMSGRGLGHTGGTIDKLECIPGFAVDLPLDRFKRQLAEIRIVLAGQTRDLAPADGRLYALRDVTATVASIPLIASSIMSKKIAAGADAIVLDVKVGNGAFMQNDAEAESLARTMIQIGAGVGRRVSAIIGEMHQPLGNTVGNTLEVLEAIAALKPDRAHINGPVTVNAGEDLVEHCFTVATEMLMLTGRATVENVARRVLQTAIEDGSALRKFREWIVAQGAGTAFLDGSTTLMLAPHTLSLRAKRSGYISALNALAVGTSAMRLGAGRAKKGERIDPTVGIVLHRKVGDQVSLGDAILTVYAATAQAADRESAALEDSIAIAPNKPELPAHSHRVLR